MQPRHARLPDEVPAPIAWQDGDEARPSGEPVSFAYDAGEQVLTLEVDDAWLSAPGRKFPVSVDPWVRLPGDGRGCALSSKAGELTANFCTATHDLKVGKVSGYTYNSVFDFDAADLLPEQITAPSPHTAPPHGRVLPRPSAPQGRLADEGDRARAPPRRIDDAPQLDAAGR